MGAAWALGEIGDARAIEPLTWTLGTPGVHEEEGLEKVTLQHDILKPKLGTFIVSREPVVQDTVKVTIA